MMPLIPLSHICVPQAAPDETYKIVLFDRAFEFRGLKHLLGAADYDKAGERLAGLAAKDEVEREAARKFLSGLTLQHIYDHPLVSDSGAIDDVMRVNYDIDHEVFANLAPLTCGAVKDQLLKAKAAE